MVPSAHDPHSPLCNLCHQLEAIKKKMSLGSFSSTSRCQEQTERVWSLQEAKRYHCQHWFLGRGVMVWVFRGDLTGDHGQEEPPSKAMLCRAALSYRIPRENHEASQGAKKILTL